MSEIIYMFLGGVVFAVVMALCLSGLNKKAQKQIAKLEAETLENTRLIRGVQHTVGVTNTQIWDRTTGSFFLLNRDSKIRWWETSVSNAPTLSSRINDLETAETEVITETIEDEEVFTVSAETEWYGLDEAIMERIEAYQLMTGYEETPEMLLVRDDNDILLFEVRRVNEKEWYAICEVESNNNPLASNEKTDARGIAQIRKICVDDVNRIIKRDRYSYADRFDPTKSREMFDIYTGYYGGDDFRVRAMVWFGGPKRLKGSLSYWKRVEKEMS